MDGRTALSRGTELNMDNNRIVRIKNEVGRGASCIVYDAYCEDSIGVCHNIRMKECYPGYLLLNREADGSVTAGKNDRVKFDKAKQNFLLSYKRNTEVRNTLGLTNSTVNSTDIFYLNNTIYVVMVSDEGIDYRAYEDRSLKELLEHIKSLAGLMKRYHQNGYLHLDIKPENVLILPETEEHILLFDFDSVVRVDELDKEGKFRFSFSDGFSAPEQVQGNVKKIGKHTDIYSIGALVFFKLFERKPVLNDCKASAVYNFEKMKYADGQYPPRLYRTLSLFLKKTLSVAAVSRWNDMQVVTDTLEELITLADTEGTYLIDSFHYNSACFIGRRQEIEKTVRILQEKQLVFLSGIGGIGKTEIARRYAQENRGRYDTIAFLVFESSIRTLVCNDISINGITRDENESDDNYFKRKINILKSILTPEDLLIIDNFDTIYDPDLEILFECPCKFIITTREDFRDFNYPQINISSMEDMDEIMQLFHSYNDIEYSQAENAAVGNMADLVEHHTMTVELIAKYLRSTNGSPVSLYDKFLEKKGITNTEEINIKQRKDRRLRVESVNNHLRILFDISDFDIYENEIIGSLSLFAGMRIKKSRFEELCDVDDVKNKIDRLVKRGWIEFNEQTEKVSLHQVIQDLIYNDFHPDASGCPHIVEGMGRYLSERAANGTESRIRQQVVDVFMQRLSGNNIAYAGLCLQYGKEDKLNEAEKICFQSDSEEAYDLLQKIYRKKIKTAMECRDMFESDMEEYEYMINKYGEISRLLDKIAEYCRKYSETPEYIAKEFIETGAEVDYGMTYMLLGHPEKTISESDGIYLRIISMFDMATEKLPYADYTYTEKKKLYKKMLEFYSGEDFMATYRNEHFSDMEKAFWYQEQIDDLEESVFGDHTTESGEDDSGIGYFHMGDVSNIDLAEEYEKKGNYEMALECYEKAYQDEEEPFDIIMQKKAHLYLKIGDPAKAVECLEQVLDEDKEFEEDPDYCTYTSYICLDLIKVFMSQGEYGKAKDYADELIYYNKPDLEKEDNAYAVKNILAADYYLYSMETDNDKKERIWRECLKYYEMSGNNRIDEEIYEFIIEYIKKTVIPYAEVLKILERIDKWNGNDMKEKIIWSCIHKYDDSEEFRPWHIIFLVKLAEMSNLWANKNTEKALRYCVMAQEYYDKYELNNEYIQNLIYKIKAESMENDSNCDYEQVKEVRRRCNYELVAEVEARNEECTDKKKVEIWRDAAEQYRLMDDYGKEIKCLNQAIEILVPILDQYDFSKFDGGYWTAAQEVVRACIKNSAFGQAYAAIKKMYDNTVNFFLFGENDKNMVEKARKIEQIADYLEETGKSEMALRVYTAAMYVGLESEPDKELIKQIQIPDGYLEQMCSKIYEHIEKCVNTEIIDTLIDLKDKMNRLMNGNDDLEILVSIIQRLSEKYQYQEVEFKRI